MTNKEKNFISVVVCLHNAAGSVTAFLREVHAQLEEHFDQYEIVAVDDCCTDGTVEQLRDYAKENLNQPLTILHMSLRHGTEQCMNAGLDCAIGDYVFEFDAASLDFAPGLVWQAYELAMQGNDIVEVCPKKVAGGSGLFYRIFNATSRSAYPLRTDVFRLVSRRAINRVHSVSENLPYRKAAYAASGLKVGTILFEGGRSGVKSENRFGLAVDSLVLYTDAGYKISFGVAVAMMALAAAELVYTLAVFLGGGHPIEGWTTTMFVMTVGFGGMFGVLAIIIKYLSILIDLVFKKQKYLVESIEKIQK